MTIDRAIEILQDWLELDRAELGGEILTDYDRFVAEKDEAIEVALEAMEYRRAVRPITSYVENGLIWPGLFCPVCHNDLWQKRIEFCDKCGQALNWEEETIAPPEDETE